MYATGAALAISGLPVAGTLGAARVGYIDDQLVANPTIEEMENSKLDLIVAGTEEGVLMVESEAQELPESTMLDAVNFGHDFYQNFIKEAHAFASKTEIKPFDVPGLPEFYEGLQKDIAGKIADPIREAYGLVDKQERSQKLTAIRSSIIENVEDDQVLAATTIIKDIEKDVVRGDIIKNKSRIDGRKLGEVRQITCELDILPRAHRYRVLRITHVPVADAKSGFPTSHLLGSVFQDQQCLWRTRVRTFVHAGHAHCHPAVCHAQWKPLQEG